MPKKPSSTPVRINSEALRWARVACGYSGESLPEYVSRVVESRALEDAKDILMEVFTAAVRKGLGQDSTDTKRFLENMYREILGHMGLPTDQINEATDQVVSAYVTAKKRLVGPALEAASERSYNKMMKSRSDVDEYLKTLSQSDPHLADYYQRKLDMIDRGEMTFEEAFEVPLKRTRPKKPRKPDGE